MFEKWKDIPGYEGFYQVSNKGHIRSLGSTKTARNGSRIFHQGRNLKPDTGAKGYKRVTFCKPGHKRRWLIHQLVLLAFVGPMPQGKDEINHRNGNPRDNALRNLEYVTKGENQLHSIYILGNDKSIGESNYNSKLTKEKVRQIRKQFDPDKRNGGELARKYGVSKTTIYNVWHRRAWDWVD